jgi:ankyrin repeat protein
MSHTTAPNRLTARDDGPTAASLDLGGGYTKLHLAANEGRKQMTQLLLIRGADIDRTTLRGNFTALFMTANRGRTSVVSLLLGAGTNAEIVSNTGFTPLVRSLCLGRHQ